jgi:type VI secretion system protein ImpG
VQILRTYDFPALHDKQAEQASRKRLAGIESIETTPIDRLVQGMPVRGLKSILSVRQSAFSSEGELYLFSTVLAHFFSLYASVNAFHLLEVVNIDNKERYRWPVQIGQHSMM